MLTKDAQGNVELWDITTGAVEERFGKVDFKQKEAELFAPESVPPWFTWDTKLGSLTLHFETPQVFAAEVYTYSMGLEVHCSAHPQLEGAAPEKHLFRRESSAQQLFSLSQQTKFFIVNSYNGILLLSPPQQ